MYSGELRISRTVSVAMILTACTVTTETYSQPVIIEEVPINLTLDVDWRINTWGETTLADPPVLPYLWVTASTRGTILRIATAEHFSAVDEPCSFIPKERQACIIMNNYAVTTGGTFAVVANNAPSHLFNADRTLTSGGHDL